MAVQVNKGMEDEEIIRRRLLIDGDGTGDARMMTKFTRGFLKLCASEEEDLEVQQERLLTTLASIEQSAVKWDNIRQMNDLQLESYAELGDATETAVGDARGALDDAKQDLAKAKQVRAHGLEYSALAKLITQHPARGPTQQRIEGLAASLDSLKATEDGLNRTIGLRKKQLHVLFTTLHQLDQSLKVDEEVKGEEEKASTLVDLTEEMDCS